MKTVRIMSASLLLTLPAVSVPQPALAHHGEGCSTGGGAAGGAVVGALLGGLAGGKHSHGAGLLVGGALGAAVGGLACMATHSQVTQQHSNDQIAAAYGARYGTVSQPTVVSYLAQPTAPSFPIDSEVVVQSHMVIAAPQNAQPLAVAERYTVITPTGEQRVFSKPIANSGGDFNNDFSFQLPKAMPKGLYQIRSELMINNQPQGARQNSFTIV